MILTPWPDQFILGVWSIVIPRAKGEALRREMEEKGPPVDVGLIGPLHPLQLQHVVLQIRMTMEPPLKAGQIWKFLEPCWVN